MPNQSRGFQVFLAIICLVILAVALIYCVPMIRFKESVLSKAVDLVAGLSVVVLLVERSLAVINNVWYGEERQKKEETLRELTQREAAVRSDLQRVEVAREAVAASAATEAVAGAPALEMLRQTTAEIESLRNETSQIATGISQAKDEVLVTETKQTRVRLLVGFVVALLVAAAGIRSLEPLVDLANACAPGEAGTGCWLKNVQLSAFRAVDILLTAGLIAGGSSGLNAISELISSYVQARQRPSP